MKPTNAALRFLKWFCPSELYEGIEGDIIEKYESDVSTLGETLAGRRMVVNVITFFRPSIIFRNRFSIHLINTNMFRNYFTIAFRNLRKNKVFSGINIIGLAIGLCVCMFIFQFVSFELSYDTFHDKYDRIYRVTNDRFQNGKLIQHGTITYPTIGPTLAKDYPEIELFSRLMPGGELNIRADQEYIKGGECHFADDHFLSVFSFPLIAGDRLTALKEPYTILLTKNQAQKYFKITDNDYASLIGKTLYWGKDKTPYKVTAIADNVPENSHIQFDALASYATLIRPEDQSADNSWNWSDMRHYVVLKPGVDYREFQKKFDDFSDRYFKGDKVSGSFEKFYLQPLSRAHLFSDYEYDIAKVASGRAVYAMLVVAGFILIIAWINYINLTTSRALDRAKEVGLRKVMGALKSQLIRQFIFESIIVTGIAFLTAVIFVFLLQNSFNQIIDANLSWLKLIREINPSALWIFIGVIVGGILLSGFYPAFILSSYQPVTVLKGKFQRSSKGHLMRKSLVIFQFTASAVLITGTLIVSRQLRFMNETDLGISINNSIVVSPPELIAWDSTIIQRIETYKHELSQINGVKNVTTSNRIPGDRLGRSFGLRLSEQPSTLKHTMSVMNVDYNFFDTYGVNVIAGRKFLPSDHKLNFNDLKTTILNENAVRLLGIENPEAAIGKEIVWGNNGTRLWTIVGVVGDYHQESLKNPMEPMIFRPAYGTFHSTTIKIGNVDPKPMIAEIEKIYKKFFPQNSFQYTFLEDRYRSQYKDDSRFGVVVSTFTVLGIIISCLGLIGLSSYMAFQRTKEIGIRKVLGASLVSIVSLLSIDFVKLVLIAAIISLPIAFFAMENWLSSYAYRINLNWLLFIPPVILILFIAALTMSFYVFKAARTNPAQTLKYE